MNQRIHTSSLNWCVYVCYDFRSQKSWNLLVGRKVIYQKHIGCWRSCGIAWLKMVSEKEEKEGEGDSPSLNQSRRQTCLGRCT